MHRFWIAVALAGALTTGVAPAAADDPPPPTFVLDDTVAEDGGLLGFRVSPARHEVELGARVRWANEGLLPHELEEEHELFRWGPIAPGEVATFRPWAAGRYEFREVHEDILGSAGTWESGRFDVAPVYDWGRRGMVVRWASRRAPEGLVYDVRATDRSGRRWKRWHPSTERATAVFPYRQHRTFDCYGFRARLRDRDDPERRLGWAESFITCIVV